MVLADGLYAGLASAAVEDMRGTADFTNKEREKHLQGLDCRYGYGSFVGRDGSAHVGIEKMPFVQRRKATTFEHSRAHLELLRRNRKKEDDTQPMSSVSKAPMIFTCPLERQTWGEKEKPKIWVDEKP